MCGGTGEPWRRERAYKSQHRRILTLTLTLTSTLTLILTLTLVPTLTLIIRLLP